MSNQNRENILQAALTVLSRNGYENTTIKDIAEAAGVAQGLIHYYFKSKQQLMVAALLVCCQKIALGVELVGDAGAGFELFRTSLREQREFQQFYVEMLGVGLHDAEIGAGVLEFMRSDRGFVETIARRVLPEVGDLDPRMVASLSAAIWGATLGIMVQNLVDPDFDPDSAVDALALMAASTIANLGGVAAAGGAATVGGPVTQSPAGA